MRTLKWYRVSQDYGDSPARYIAKCGGFDYAIFDTGLRDFPWNVRRRFRKVSLNWESLAVSHRLDEAKNYCERFSDPLIAAMSEAAQ